LRKALFTPRIRPDVLVRQLTEPGAALPPLVAATANRVAERSTQVNRRWQTSTPAARGADEQWRFYVGPRGAQAPKSCQNFFQGNLGRSSSATG